MPTVTYWREQAYGERILASIAAGSPQTRIVRMRTGFVLSGPAASGIRRLFVSPFLPGPLVRRGPVGTGAG